jgi:hypothetical protein
VIISEYVGRLILERRGGRLVHVLDGRIVEQDVLLELKIRSGWLAGAYQWSGSEARWPGLRVPLDDEPKADRAAVLAVHPDATLRWPQHK